MTTSECPPIYFVQLLSETSKPNSNGDCKYGLQKVLSPRVRIFFYLAILATPYKSISLRVGLVGVSTQINLVLGLIALTMLSRFVISTKSSSNPNFSLAKSLI